MPPGKNRLIALVVIALLSALSYAYLSASPAQRYTYSYTASTCMELVNPSTNQTIKASAVTIITITKRYGKGGNITLYATITHKKVTISPSSYSNAIRFTNKTLKASIDPASCSLVEKGAMLQPSLDQFYCNASKLYNASLEGGFKIKRRDGNIIITYSNATKPLSISIEAIYSTVDGILRHYRARIYSSMPSQSLGVREIREEINITAGKGAVAWLRWVLLGALLASVLAIVVYLYHYLHRRKAAG